MTAGVLVIISTQFESEVLNIEAVNLSDEKEINPSFENNLESALAYVKHIEKREIEHDAQFAVESNEKLEYYKDLQQVDLLTWGEITAKGYYKIESVWGGGLKDGGAEYRFIPMTADL